MASKNNASKCLLRIYVIYYELEKYINYHNISVYITVNLVGYGMYGEKVTTIQYSIVNTSTNTKIAAISCNTIFM